MTQTALLPATGPAVISDCGRYRYTIAEGEAT
jgi:hypothetical protein